MTPTFSLLHASYGRPEKALAAMRMWLERADNPDAIEYIFALNSDDPTAPQVVDAIKNLPGVDFVQANFAGSAPAWDAAACASAGEILIQAQDDVEPPSGGWDVMLLEWLEGANTDRDFWRRHPTVVAVQDGYRRDKLLCTAICNRARYRQQGEFLNGQFWSMFSDDDFSYRAYRDERDGKCMVVRTDLEFRHEHHYHNKAIPMDGTYARENSSEAYRIGAELFLRRNPEVATDGIKTW